MARYQNFQKQDKKNLVRGEKVLGDLGYRGDTKIITELNATSKKHKYAMDCARARHETVNRRLKTWGALKKHFRHSRHDHHLFFRSAVVIEQIKTENGNPPFQVTNYIDPIRF